MATVFREWLPMVLHYVEPWQSDGDIDAGDRWAQSVAGELAKSDFGIVCVTPENMNSPWVLFEAGALTKSLETGKVIPLLLGLEFSEISGPLAQFQAKKLTRDGVAETIRSIQNSASMSSHGSPIPDDRAERLLDALWPELENQLKNIPENPPTGRQDRPSQRDVMEELVATVRALDTRLRDSETSFETNLATLGTIRENQDRLLRTTTSALRRVSDLVLLRAELHATQVVIGRMAEGGRVTAQDLAEMKSKTTSEEFKSWVDQMVELVGGLEPSVAYDPSEEPF